MRRLCHRRVPPRTIRSRKGIGDDGDDGRLNGVRPGGDPFAEDSEPAVTCRMARPSPIGITAGVPYPFLGTIAPTEVDQDEEGEYPAEKQEAARDSSGETGDRHLELDGEGHGPARW